MRLLGIHRRVGAVAVSLPLLGAPLAAADFATPFAVKAPPASPLYDWTGFYVGGHVGLAFGDSNWTASATGAGTPAAAGSLTMYQSPNAFYESGSWLLGVQGGYNYMLTNRMVLGVEVDATFPAFQNPAGLSTGGIASFTAPTLGAVTYSETMLSSGTVRGRIGYAPGNWLFYGTFGFAWTYDQQTLTQAASGFSESPLLWRLGWAAGAGIEAPIAPSWTVKGEYLWTGFPSQSVSYPASGQRIGSSLALQELRLSLNYRFDDPSRPAAFAPSRFTPTADVFAVHGQATFTEQAYPSFRSPYAGQNSLDGTAQGRETIDATLSTGVKLWPGAEFWANPEIDQGFGFNNTHGLAGFPSAESYKLGWAYPYARVQRAFVRQTINLGGEPETVDADFTQFAGTRSADRLVLTVGRFGVVDIFDTNRFANNPKSDFLNWSMINTGTFDYAGDGWGYTYGAAAEWYTGRWTFRAGVFDLSNTPAGGASPTAYALDPTFRQFQMVGEIEERHELWGQPGKIKVTGFLSRGAAGAYDAAVAIAQATGQPADINAVRATTSRPGVSVNFEQQLTETLGVFGRAGWADGNVEPWDFTDIDRTAQLGVSISGKAWGRPDDTIGVAGVLNGISSQHVAFLNAGGLGILIGDGQLTNYGIEKIFEAYYSYALTASTKLTFDYQFIADPGYNADRGPVNIFAGRVHWQF
ncbi:MAG: carbohydrate porin [Xanthobacteraceae bacterium]|nr:carbohydrate porin [Xanthobacteraceae bacterium]